MKTYTTIWKWLFIIQHIIFSFKYMYMYIRWQKPEDFQHCRPIYYIGKSTVYTARKTHNFFVFLARKAHAWKPPESRTGFLVRGAHARFLAALDCSAAYIAQYVAGCVWVSGRSRPTWPKTQLIPARGEQAFTLAKNQWKTGGVSKNHTSEVVFFLFGFFAVFRGSCLATSNEKLECEKNSFF